MADTEKTDQPQTNGVENGLDDEERAKMRPADIDADVKEMERRKRVEMIMSSRLFREELERIIELQMKDGNGPAGLLQQISDMMGIHSGKLHTAQYMFRGSNCVAPINDIRGVESMGYEKGEKNLRCKLASVFRLMDLYGWSQGLNNQITARLNQDEEHFLVNPHGMLFNEITASSLVKVDMQGNIVEQGTTNLGIHNRGFLLHSAIHSSRPDVNCVIHIKTPSVLAVSSLKCGLLPLCHESLVIGEVSQHPFVSGIFEPEELEKIIRNLGPTNKVLLLHNHGAVCCGATVEEAFYNVYNTVLACETQIKLMPVGVENLILVNDETRKQVYDAAHRNPDGAVSGQEKKAKQFRVGELEFEALIRMLDNAGFRTGYIYRHPLVKGDLPKPKNDVEVPPAVSSLGYLIEQEEMYKQGNWKKYVDGRNRLDRTKWLNSPNVYQKVEILETGTSDPKKITKWVDQNSEEWVAESSPTHSSTPVKIESALQFVPKGTNPKEFKKLQQQIKENRRADKITSGPQSHILEGVSWEEAKKLQDANITQTGDQVILVGAASKGIIQRNYQHNALVYKTPYAKNPFDSMSDKEIEDYKQLVERKQRGDTDYEESQSESEAVSSSRQDGLRHIKSPLLSPHSATSETEEESRDEPRVLRIETKTAPRPIQAEVVLSDAESDTTDARVERSHSARYPKAEKPESVNLMNSFRKSWSLKREKDKSKDLGKNTAGGIDSTILHPSLLPNEPECTRMEPLHYCVARIKQLTFEPVFVDLNAPLLHQKFKSASHPCDLNRLTAEDQIFSLDDRRTLSSSKDQNTSLSCNNIASDVKMRLSIRKKLIKSAKMKFLGLQNADGDVLNDKASTSPMRALISEIRETINEIVSPDRSLRGERRMDDYLNTLRWIERPKFVPRVQESDSKETFIDMKERSPARKLISDEEDCNNILNTESPGDFKRDFHELEKSDGEDEAAEAKDLVCKTKDVEDKRETGVIVKVDENENYVKETELVHGGNVSDEEATFTITDDSVLPTYSFTETTETEWYYNKTIMKLENSQTVLEIKDGEKKEIENRDNLIIKNTDTGIDTDFTSEKENEENVDDLNGDKHSSKTDEAEIEKQPLGDTSVLNKSSETDSSFVKSSGGYTSNDIDTSAAFRTETENSEKINQEETEKPKENENVPDVRQNASGTVEKNVETHSKLPDIPESPEFSNIDTEDAPATSSSKNTSPEVLNEAQLTEDEPLIDKMDKVPEKNNEQDEKSEPKPEKKRRKRNKKSSTKITVKKEMKEKNSVEPVVKEFKLTIKNSNPCQSEKVEVKIQDVTSTSEELSSSLGENTDSFGTYDVVESSCVCQTQESLEKLQGEVSTTIEKLHTIEDYFEHEIMKHAIDEENDKKAPEELAIEYNYGEFEDTMNESRIDKGLAREKNFDKNQLEPENLFDASKCLTSSTLNSFEKELEISGNEETVDFRLPEISLASLSSRVQQKPDKESGETEITGKAIKEKEDENLNQKVSETKIETLDCSKLNETFSFDVLDTKKDVPGNKNVTEEIFESEKVCTNNMEDTIGNAVEATNVKICLDLVEDLISGSPPAKLEEFELGSEKQEVSVVNEPTESSAIHLDDKDGQHDFFEYLNLIRKRLTSPLKALTWHENKFSWSSGRVHMSEMVAAAATAAAVATSKFDPPVICRVTNFILGSEESPTDSLAEFEDMENLISTSSSIVAEIIDSIESKLEEEETGSGSRRSSDCVFKVVVRTPTKKEIFINYSQDSSSSFDLSNNFEFCNSYIKTDDVNEDFEAFSSDNSAFFSMGGSTPGKGSPNSSFESYEVPLTGSQSRGPICGEEIPAKSPRSLSVIQEVDEGEGSSTSERCKPIEPLRVGENTINGDHSDAHQSTFSHSSKEGSPTKDRSMEDSPRKDKKKKKGLRTPSFLKKKKEKKKIAETA